MFSCQQKQNASVEPKKKILPSSDKIFLIWEENQFFPYRRKSMAIAMTRPAEFPR